MYACKYQRDLNIYGQHPDLLFVVPFPHSKRSGAPSRRWVMCAREVESSLSWASFTLVEHEPTYNGKRLPIFTFCISELLVLIDLNDARGFI